MSRIWFACFFVCSNLLFIFSLIYKNSYLVELSFAKQKHEKEKSVLLKEKASLIQELYNMQNQAHIKEYAINTLHMKKIKLKDLKSLPTS